MKEEDSEQVAAPPGLSSGSRRSTARQLTATALLGALLAAWIAAPAVVSHLAAFEPLWFETVALSDLKPTQDLAFRGRLPNRADPRWSMRFTSVLENGNPLARRGLRTVQSSPGKFAPRPQVVFFSSSDRSDPRSNGRVYEARRPRPVSTTVATLLGLLLLGLHVAAAVVLLPELFRKRLSGPMLLSTALALTGFGIVGGIVDRLPMTQGVDLLGARLDDFRRAKDSFDALFLGSSRIYRQLDPRVFDAVFAEAERPMRSFNLGTPGTRMFEVLTTVRWVLALRPLRLRLLVVDCNSDPLRVDWENLQTARVIRYHGLRNTIAILGGVSASESAVAEKLHEASQHLRTSALRVGNVGRALGWLASASSERSPFVPPLNRGYLSLEEQFRKDSNRYEKGALRKRYDSLHSNLGGFRNRVRRLSGRNNKRPKINELEVSLFRALEKEAQEHGVRVVFLIDSRLNPRYDLVHAFEIGAVETLLRFDDPERFPAFYDPDNRFDIHHLNEQTSRLYTRLVAQNILASAEPR